MKANSTPLFKDVEKLLPLLMHTIGITTWDNIEYRDRVRAKAISFLYTGRTYFYDGNGNFLTCVLYPFFHDAKKLALGEIPSDEEDARVSRDEHEQNLDYEVIKAKDGAMFSVVTSKHSPKIAIVLVPDQDCDDVEANCVWRCHQVSEYVSMEECYKNCVEKENKGEKRDG